MKKCLKILTNVLQKCILKDYLESLIFCKDIQHKAYIRFPLWSILYFYTIKAKGVLLKVRRKHNIWIDVYMNFAMQCYFPSSTFIIIFCSIFLQLKLVYIVLRGMCFSCKWHSVYLTCLKFVFVKEMMFCCIKMYLSCLTGKNRMAKTLHIILPE